MSNFIDMTGWVMSEHGVFDSRWTVIEKDQEWAKNHSQTKWICRCNCEKHTIKSIYGTYLRSGQSKSCGCLQKEKGHERLVIDMTGWNMWEHGVPNSLITVIEKDLDWSKSHNKVKWKCKCNCGNNKIFSVFGTDLRNGNTTSCGCKNINRLKSQKIDMTGWIMSDHGVPESKITVLKESSYKDKSGHIYWICQCNCNNHTIFTATANHLREGSILSCGCYSGSKGENQIASLLTQNDICFKREFIFDDLYSNKNKPLRFDFALFNNDKLICLIEFQGRQHFYKDSIFEGKDSFEDRKKRDQQKIVYCNKNNIKLYFINFYDNIEQKIKEIIKEEFYE